MKINTLLPLAMALLAYTAFAGTVKIQGEIQGAASAQLQCTIVDNALDVKPRGLAIPVRDDGFSHTFDFSGATFLSFSDGTNYFGGFVEPGDSVFVAYSVQDFSGSVSYRGRGAEKFDIAWDIGQLKKVPKTYQAVARTNQFPVDYLFAVIDSLEKGIDQRINHSVKNITSQSAHLMRGFLAATALLARQNSLVAIFGDSFTNVLKDHQKALSPGSIDRIRSMLKFDESYADSKMYVEAVEVFATIYLEENVQPSETHFAERKYDLLTNMLPEKLRSPVLFRTLVSDLTHHAAEINEPVLRRAAGQLTNTQGRQYVLDMLSETRRLKDGDSAPDFTLRNLAGEDVSLASFRGKTVYMDFWFAACGPCHVLFKAIEPVKKQFAHDDRVVFLTVSIDNEAVWKKAIARFNIKGYHAFTENKLREHPIIQSYQVAAYPTTFLIDPAGRFHAVRPSQNPEALAKQITESLRAVGK